MKIFIDNGHDSIDTAGKRSPDGRFLEYKFNRIIASRIVAELQARGYDTSLLVSEENDVSLAVRCCKVNAWCQAHGAGSCILVSIYANAFSNGKEWTSPRGTITNKLTFVRKFVRNRCKFLIFKTTCGETGF